MGINRNIVECKYVSMDQILSLLVVLIETLWNVNIIFLITDRMKLGINRNIVECKFSKKASGRALAIMY